MDLRGLAPQAHDRVYPVREDTLLLASSARVERGERVLEVGCGLGLATLAAARCGGRAVAADLNPFAVRAVRASAAHLRLRVEGVRTDLFAGLGRFDVVLCNPPYLPTEAAERDRDPWHDVALNGGPDGKEVVRRFVGALPEHLVPGGRAYLLVASLPAAPVRAPGLPVPSTKVRVEDVVGDRVLPGETLWVLELRV